MQSNRDIQNDFVKAEEFWGFKPFDKVGLITFFNKLIILSKKINAIEKLIKQL